MAIPKIIHYVWFGRGKHSKLQKKCIKSWKKYCPDFEIKLWNEDNFDVSKAPVYVQQAYAAKKWAFVSDYVRLWALYNWGGIYLDTDAEVLKDISHLLKNEAFLAWECDDMVNTGVMGCMKGEPILKEMLEFYDPLEFNPTSPVVTGRYITQVLVKHGLQMGGALSEVEGWVVYPFEYFYPIKLIHNKTFYTENTCICHWWEGTWWPQEYKVAKKHDKNILIRVARKIGLVKIYHRLFKKN